MPRSTFRFWFTIIAVPSFLVVGVLGYLAWRQAVPGVRAALDPEPRWIGVRTPLAVDLVASRGGVRSVEIRLRQIQAPAERRCVLGEPLAVAFGVRIARFDDAAERDEQRFRCFQFVGKLLEFEQRLNAGKQLFWKNRLLQKIVGARFDAQHTVLTIS